MPSSPPSSSSSAVASALSVAANATIAVASALSVAAIAITAAPVAITIAAAAAAAASARLLVPNDYFEFEGGATTDGFLGYMLSRTPLGKRAPTDESNTCDAPPLRPVPVWVPNRNHG